MVETGSTCTVPRSSHEDRATDHHVTTTNLLEQLPLAEVLSFGFQR